MKVDTAIIDLDNCISNDKWRWPLFQLHRTIPGDRYTDYHEACFGDTYENKDVVDRLAREYKLVVFTSRPECVRLQTKRWINSWQIPIDRILMRPDDNHQSSVTLKQRMLLEWLPDDYNVLYAIDDHIEILDMYAIEGVSICQHVSINPLEHEHS